MRSIARQVSQRRRGRVDAEATARQQVNADEQRLRTPGARHMTLGQAFRMFWRHPSPWILATALVGAAAARAVTGGYAVTDLILPLVMIATFPVVEWVIHVVVLHYRPVQVAGRVIDTRLARDHRAHHCDPRDLPLVFIPWQTFLWLLPVNVVVALTVFDRTGLGLTFLTTLSAIGMGYEWIHYLIHSDHRPVSRAYRALWRNHRLHHYKDERYWFTVTSARTADRLFRTCPDPADIPTSPTAKDLLGSR